MNKSELFKTAHRIAKADRGPVAWTFSAGPNKGKTIPYSWHFANALKRLYKRQRAQALIARKQQLQTAANRVSADFFDGKATELEYSEARKAVETATQAVYAA